MLPSISVLVYSSTLLFEGNVAIVEFLSKLILLLLMIFLWWSFLSVCA